MAFDEGRPLFLQVAESVEDSIVSGALGEEERAPSTNELVAFYRINPATAAKGIGVLVDKGLLYKRRGLGMFVATGAREALLGERRGALVQRYIDPLLAEGSVLGLTAADVLALVQARSISPDTSEGKRP